ncbi:MAG: hypothetical protein HC873_06365 [Leptolyngbyaceae cyanobacterium SL_1_1]|nr:hypothetical protein [Leptolyngbyaceae cyanobacterium RM1_1_2]NJO09332.1 hypothetical protein [Leptolyngbyaceae cyanobacterium SL_1_1]
MPAYAPAVGAVLLVCSLTTGLTGCAAPQKSVEKSAEEIEEVTEAAPLPESASSPTAAVTATAKATVPAPQPDYFREGVNTATSAVSIGQTAQSQDDWKLAAARWRKAIADLQKVPADSPNHALAQQKIKEYQQHLISAEASAAGKTASPAARIAASVASDGRKAQFRLWDAEVAFRWYRQRCRGKTANIRLRCCLTLGPAAR